MNLYIMMSMRTEMKLQLYAFRLHINVFKVKQQKYNTHKTVLQDPFQCNTNYAIYC
jgi:hypothetical protein